MVPSVQTTQSHEYGAASCDPILDGISQLPAFTPVGTNEQSNFLPTFWKYYKWSPALLRYVAKRGAHLAFRDRRDA